eukprot:2012039-Pleurochrysis_carterae.AAC.1
MRKQRLECVRLSIVFQGGAICLEFAFRSLRLPSYAHEPSLYLILCVFERVLHDIAYSLKCEVPRGECHCQSGRLLK